MKIGIVCGSHRPVSESGKIARHIEKELIRQGVCESTWLFDLGGNPLPLWDEGIWSGDAEWQKILAPLNEEVRSCDAFVIVSPEYHGTVPAGLKNFMLMWAGGGEMAHKPALIVTVSVSDGGSYPVAELRMSSYKNNRLCYLPEHLIIRRVAGVFNDDAEKNDARSQPYYEERLAYCLGLLGEYASAFRQIRTSGKASLENYGTGM